MKKIDKEKSNFEYFQPNTHKCGDCAVRAVVKATNSSWYTVFDDLIPIARKMQLMPNDRKVIGKYLESKGFRWVPIKVSKGSKRPTVKEFASKYTGIYVLSLASHLTAVANNKYYDIWDCGNRSLYGYWVKE